MNSRASLLAGVKRIVIKVGSSFLTSDAGYLSHPKIKALTQTLIKLVETYHKEVILVSSGAIACGMGTLELKKRPTDLAMLQAAASIGQGKLINTYETFLNKKGYHAAQVLLTADVVHTRERYLNARNTMNTLLNLGNVIPIVNENDTVATEEIRFGDNDNLSAQVALMANADLLIILSDVDGFCVTKGNKFSVLHTIDTIDQSLRSHVREVKKGKTVGGMQSKLDTGFMLMRLGMPLIIANGNTKGIIEKIMKGSEIGTLFLPCAKEASKKRWLAFTANAPTAGSITVDAGAYKALVEKGKSLLASGVRACAGRFAFGDAVRMVSPDGVVFAKGITNFSHSDLERIKGKRNEEIKALLGNTMYDEVIHRDNMIIIV